MNKTKDIDVAFSQFQEWADTTIDKRGGKQGHYTLQEYNGFCPPYLGKDLGFGEWRLPKVKGGAEVQDYVPYVIQQIREEIYEFMKALLANGKLGSALEIGLGDFGGLHILLSQIFRSVWTLDINEALILQFVNNNRNLEILANDRLLLGHSRTAFMGNELKEQGFDLLFIDGDHTFESVEFDHTHYHQFVNIGGVVAFHDSHSQGTGSIGAKRYVDSIRGKYNIQNCWHPEGYCAGISYYIKQND